jgi:steroid delta-isomerase-like uncharacterized protein
VRPCGTANIVSRIAVEENKQLVRSFYAEVINGRDVDAIDRLLSPDFTHNGETRGREGQKDAVRAFLDGFSDLDNRIEVILGEGELIAAHQRWSGTHDGKFLGVAATGRHVSFGSTAILTVREGRIAAAIDVVDIAGLMAQLSPTAAES